MHNLGATPKPWKTLKVTPVDSTVPTFASYDNVLLQNFCGIDNLNYNVLTYFRKPSHTVVLAMS